eukprot:symbB.v1.2.001729.t1/scaffold61.1/size362833/28
MSRKDTSRMIFTSTSCASEVNHPSDSTRPMASRFGWTMASEGGTSSGANVSWSSSANGRGWDAGIGSTSSSS